MKKINIGRIVIVLLVIFIVSLLYISYDQKKQLSNNATGTYSITSEELPNTGEQDYLALNSDGGYYYYKQFKIISKGKYVREDGYDMERIYTLREDKKLFGQFILYGDKCYLCKDKCNIMPLSKISEEFTLINVEKRK